MISTGENLQVVKVHGHYWHRFKALGNEPIMLIYFINRLYDYNNLNEIRRTWNDTTIISKKINEKDSDSFRNRPWDWFYPPLK